MKSVNILTIYHDQSPDGNTIVQLLSRCVRAHRSIIVVVSCLDWLSVRPSVGEIHDAIVAATVAATDRPKSEAEPANRNQRDWG